MNYRRHFRTEGTALVNPLQVWQGYAAGLFAAIIVLSVVVLPRL